jgi:hypothetical protein
MPSPKTKQNKTTLIYVVSWIGYWSRRKKDIKEKLIE